jgi:phosphatidylinositol 4-kinase A
MQCHRELLHHLVALPFAAFTSTTVSAGVEAWSWVISEKPEYELILMSELTTSWIKTIKQAQGVFSTNLKSVCDSMNSFLLLMAILISYADPFYHSVEYSPSDSDYVHRSIKAAQRQLVPHSLILQFLMSRLQAARYRKPGIMHLLQRLALKSARAHARMRSVLFSAVIHPI